MVEDHEEPETDKDYNPTPIPARNIPSPESLDMYAEPRKTLRQLFALLDEEEKPGRPER